MRSTRTALATALATAVAGFALMAGMAGQAAAASPSQDGSVVAGAQNEVPWTGPVPGVIGSIIEIIETITEGEVPWT
jgi:hypothetical protein